MTEGALADVESERDAMREDGKVPVLCLVKPEITNNRDKDFCSHKKKPRYQ
jgi:hypothetical protein